MKRSKPEIVVRQVSKGHYLLWDRNCPSHWARFEGVEDVGVGLEHPSVIERLDRGESIDWQVTTPRREKLATVRFTLMPIEVLRHFEAEVNRLIRESRTYSISKETSSAIIEVQNNPRDGAKLREIAQALEYAPSLTIGQERDTSANAGRKKKRGAYGKHRPQVPTGARAWIRETAFGKTKEFHQISKTELSFEVHSDYANIRTKKGWPALSRKDIKSIIQARK